MCKDNSMRGYQILRLLPEESGRTLFQKQRDDHALDATNPSQQQKKRAFNKSIIFYHLNHNYLKEDGHACLQPRRTKHINGMTSAKPTPLVPSSLPDKPYSLKTTYSSRCLCVSKRDRGKEDLRSASKWPATRNDYLVWCLLGTSSSLKGRLFPA